jgi:hypothetical protein
VISARAPAGSRVPTPPLLGLALVGVAATIVALVASTLPPGDGVRPPAAARVFLVASAAALVLVVALAPHRPGRWELLAVGLAALGGQAALTAVADPFVIAVVLVLIGFGHATRPSPRPFAGRARGPAFAALLLGLGWALAGTPGPAWLGRAGALALALSLAAAAGLLPYLPDVDAREPASSSYVAWAGFFGPALALTLPGRLHGLSPDEGTVFGAALVGLGLVNLGWGTVGAWRTASDAAAWRYSFLADWGLALTGIGLFRPAGLAGAYLALLSIVLVRLPLYVWARPALPGEERSRLGPLQVILIVLLAGAAPFAGFPIRLLVLQAATQAAWPLAIFLLLAMLLWIGHAPRLARTVTVPHGGAAAGLWLTLALSLGLGLAPGLLRAAGGL